MFPVVSFFVLSVWTELVLEVCEREMNVIDNINNNNNNNNNSWMFHYIIFNMMQNFIRSQ